MIKRKLFSELVDHLPQKEMSLIIGPRQSGKTTLMEMLKAHLDQRGERTLFLNLDIEWDRPHFESQAALLKKIELELGRKRGYVFIDEIQRKDDAGLFLKGVFDLKLPYKFILSGSGIFAQLYRQIQPRTMLCHQSQFEQNHQNQPY